jgi:hypothetical protein
MAIDRWYLGELSIISNFDIVKVLLRLFVFLALGLPDYFYYPGGRTKR